MAMARIHSLLDKWLPVSITPPDRDLEVCVIDKGGVTRLFTVNSQREADKG